MKIVLLFLIRRPLIYFSCIIALARTSYTLLKKNSEITILVLILEKNIPSFIWGLMFSSVQSLSHVWLCDSMDCSTPGLPVHHQLPELTQTHVYRVGDAIQPSHPLSAPSPPTFNCSQHQGLFQWISSLHQVIKYWSFSFSISPSNDYSGLISFRMDWLDLHAAQGTLKSLL